MGHLILLALIVLTPKPAKLQRGGGIPENTGSQASKQPNSVQPNDNSSINGSIPTERAQTTNRDENTGPTDENIEVQRRLVLFTALLVLAGFVTAAVICWQSWETRKAAKATADSVKLQQVALSQWVATGEWKQKPRYVDGLLAEIILGIPIQNETKFPLTLESVVATLNRTEEIKVVKTEIAPRDFHTVSFRVRPEGHEVTQYQQNQFFLVVGCSVTFTDVFKVTQTTTFNRLYRCGPQEFEQKDKYTKDETPQM